MMGPTHATLGAAVWLTIGSPIVQATGHHLTPAQNLVAAGICAGQALIPDWDSPQSTAARSHGPLSVGIAHVVNGVSATYYNATKGPREEHRSDGHRQLTHTLWGQLAFTLLVGVLVGWGGKEAVAGVLFVSLGLALRGLLHDWAKKNGWIGTNLAAAALTALALQVMPADSYWWVSLTVFLGVASHSLGDWPTKDGVAYVAPLVTIHGKRWWDFALPKHLRMTTGGGFERVLLGVFTAWAGVGAVAAFSGWGALGARVGL